MYMKINILYPLRRAIYSYTMTHDTAYYQYIPAVLVDLEIPQVRLNI